jgi:ligand-binding SRPBCC domain-containing protein
MTVDFELVTTLAVPPSVAFDAARDIGLHLRSMSGSDERAVAGIRSGLIEDGETVTWDARHFGIRMRMTSRVTEFAAPDRFVDEQIAGPFASFRHEHLFESVAIGTRMVDRVEFAAPFGLLGSVVERIVLRRYLMRLISDRNAAVAAHLRSGRH